MGEWIMLRLYPRYLLFLTPCSFWGFPSVSFLFFRTATPEGIEMTRVLSTLNSLEKSRFEAFRRCTLPSNAIREYIAHLLLQHQERLVGRCHASTGLLGTSGFGTGLPHLERAMIAKPGRYATAARTTSKEKNVNRPLDDLVQPGDADSIVVVVSALAKAYAQRLVTAARRVASVMEGYSSYGATAEHEQKPLQVEHIQMAYDARVQAGIDPGFFLARPKSVVSSVVGKIAAAAVGVVDRHELMRLAALQAQEDYDRFVEGGKSNADVGTEPMEEDESSHPAAKDHPIASLAAELQDSPQQSMEVDLLEDDKVAEEVEETQLTSSSPEEAQETLSIEEEVNTPLPQLEVISITNVPAHDSASLTTPTVQRAPTGPTSTRSEPMSMEDALLNDLDDDSDDDDDED
jgi:hypothetical protein